MVSKAEQSTRTKAQLLDAAVALFGERGYRATPLKAIGERAEVSHGVIPFHFGSKEGLLLAVVERGFEVFRAAVLGPLAGRERDFGLGDLRALMDAQLAFQREHPEVGRLFHVLMFEATLDTEPDLRPHFRAFHARMHEVGAAWLRAGQARGSIDDSLDVDATVDALLSFFTGLRTHSLLLERFDSRAVHEQMHAVLARGVLPTRSTREGT